MGGFREFLICFFVLTLGCFAQAATTTRKIELTENYRPVTKDGAADLFIPMPMKDADYQTVLNETHESNASWIKEESVKINPDGDVVRILHAHWDKPDKPTLELHEVFNLSDRDSGSTTKRSTAYYLQPTEHVQTDGIVKETAAKATKGLTDPDQKAEAIYNWIVDNTFRDPKVRGCGTGDVKSMLKVGNLSGKCADLNSLFVALARASGIPAREVWGLRVAPSDRSKSLGKEGDVSKSQHCRAEYYSVQKKAWIPADPADIRKVILEENLSLNDAHVKELRGRFFGTWEGNWVAFNSGRDFKLSNGKTLNFLMYPQLLSGSFAPDGADPTETGYTFTSKVLPN